MTDLAKIAAESGFIPAPRPGVDEARYAYSTLTHIVFVSTRHELLRLDADAPTGVVDEFRRDLDEARGWCESATDGRIIRVGRIELRPLSVIEALVVAPGDELHVVLPTPEGQALHPPDDWPVLAEDPEVGG